MKKTTVKASTDVALIKYWGKKDEILRLPENGSISIILKGLDTITTVEFDESLSKDQITIEGESDKHEIKRVVTHLDRIRALKGVKYFAKVESKNTFPKGTGLSSSGSGFAALTLAASTALDLDISQKERSILARQGSGTACRCVCGGFVEWKNGDTSNESYSTTIFSQSHWDIRDIVAVVDYGKKQISSTEGHKMARTSPFYDERLKNISSKIIKIKKLIEVKDFINFGELVEQEALEFHSILLTSTPSMIAWYPGTIEVMQCVQAMRKNGILAYFTINTGFNVHVLTLPEYELQVCEQLSQLSLVKKVIKASIGEGPTIIDEHLF